MMGHDREQILDERITDIASPDSLPVRPGHPLYPMLAIVALTGIAFGPIGDQVAGDMPGGETHPYFPDHFWPYPILAIVLLATLGLLAYFGQPLLQSTQAADPRAVEIPHPDWYFLFLFQLLKLGPALVMSILIPALAVTGLLAWPVIDARIGPPLARRLGWRMWPAPGKNVITGTLWLVGLGTVAILTVWALIGSGA